MKECLLARGDDKLCDIILVCDILYINNQSFLALIVACFFQQKLWCMRYIKREKSRETRIK